MTEVISVRFRNGCKEYYFDPRGLTVPANTDVIVETAQGAEFALCAVGNHLVEDDTVVKPLRGVLRIATDNDRHTAAYNRGREKEAFEVCKKKIQQHKLEMKLVRVECSFDGSKILFFFTADGRVDFRELVKDLAGVFRARIELRQIGIRDEAKMIGGLGICGRPFCCAQFMDEFLPVSIKMAKTQSLSLNPTKISGTCGRLMCCLKYEQDAYEDAIKRMPKNDSFVLTPDGTGNVSEVNVLKETVNVKLDDPYAPFLCPNQYVNYTPDTEAVQTSYELCAGMTDPQEIFETIQAYIKANYLYDYVKAETVKSGTLPDIDGCYESKMGICQDLAALAACMLRVQGIPTRLMIGYAGKMYHAWNTVIINGEEVLYDPTLELSAIDSGLTYTVERYY